jgi:hypothetical protein
MFPFDKQPTVCELENPPLLRDKSTTGWWLTYPSEKYESQLGYYSQYIEK